MTTTHTAHTPDLDQILWKGGAGNWQECQRQARLIAAAPALLEALEALLGASESLDEQWDDEIMAAEAAIDAAKGISA